MTKALIVSLQLILCTAICNAKLSEAQIDSLRNAAADGNPRAAYELGIAHVFGDGVQVDPMEAIKFFELAAAKGEDAAYFPLAILYDGSLYANTVVEDEDKTMAMLRKSMATGNTRAMLMFAIRNGFDAETPAKIRESKQALEKAVALGDPAAMCELGEHYLEGSGYPEDENKGYQLMIKAAEKGNKRAFFYAGFAYYNGKSVTKDVPKAIECWTKSWELDKQGQAAYCVGLCYENGDGVPRDIKKAVEWYKKGATIYNSSCLEALQELGY